MRYRAMTAAIGLVAMLAAPAAGLAQQGDTVGKAMTEPLRDTRIKDQKIPPILLLAASAPYSSVGTRSCGSIAAEVAKLDVALGPDVDAPARQRGEGAAVAAVAARTVVNSLIPGLGIVKVITGADKAQRRVEAAVYAGNVRRAYLKGVGLVRGCRAPGAPTSAAAAETPELPPEVPAN